MSGVQANDAEQANHKWVREEIKRTLSGEQLLKTATAAASGNWMPGVGVGIMLIAMILFAIAAGYANSLAHDMKTLVGQGGSWTDIKLGGKLTTVIPLIVFGFVLLAIALLLLHAGSEIMLQLQNRLAFGIATFALLISVIPYVIAIATRTLPMKPSDPSVHK